MPFPVELTRFEDTVRHYEAMPVETGKLLLYGSSFFANWRYARAKEQLLAASGCRYDAVNHGFGGATADELLYYYPRLVRPYAPRAMLLRSGVNDLSAGRYTPREAWEITRRVLQWVRTDFPGIRVGVLCVFDYPSAPAARREAYRDYDQLARAWCAQEENADFLDINDFFQSAPSGDDRQVFRDIFRSDGLHLTDAGYGELAVYLANLLRKLGYE